MQPLHKIALATPAENADLDDALRTALQDADGGLHRDAHFFVFGDAAWAGLVKPPRSKTVEKS